MKAKGVLILAVLGGLAACHATLARCGETIPELPEVWVEGLPQRLTGIHLAEQGCRPKPCLKLATLVQKGLSGQKVEAQARVDLIQVFSGGGLPLELPRAFVQKYPLVLMPSQGQWLLTLGAPPAGVAMALPPQLRDNAGMRVQRIGLSSYVLEYRELLLGSRSDPWAVRGETVFLQNCVSCHRLGVGMTSLDLYRSWARSGQLGGAVGHAGVDGVGSEQTSLKAYFESYWEERALHLDPFVPFPYRR